ncbi:MAG TPA: zinc ribbon domain-containing protein [Candidatus Limnocylindrales bacterium]|nr:zinc ribbon domain-containing protein [Candidatus Limnocylindrales bacterium]
MGQITDTIGNFFGGLFASPLVQTGLKAAGIYLVLLWLAAAFWAYQDLRQRTANPIAPYLAAALIICFTPLFFLFGVLLYRLVRPTETVAEANERALAEEAMLVEVEAQAHCANCSRSVQPGWIICPTCRNRLRRVCPECGKLVELDWSLCAWCGKDFEPPAHVARPAPVAVRTGQRTAALGAGQHAPVAEPGPAPVTSLGRPAEPAPAPSASAPATLEPLAGGPAPRGGSPAPRSSAPRPSAQRQ